MAAGQRAVPPQSNFDLLVETERADAKKCLAAAVAKRMGGQNHPNNIDLLVHERASAEKVACDQRLVFVNEVAQVGGDLQAENAALKEKLAAMERKARQAKHVLNVNPGTGTFTISERIPMRTLKRGDLITVLPEGASDNAGPGQLAELVEVKVEGNKLTFKAYRVDDTAAHLTDWAATTGRMTAINFTTDKPMTLEAIGPHLLTNSLYLFDEDEGKKDVSLDVKRIAVDLPVNLRKPTHRLVGDSLVVPSAPGTFNLGMAEKVILLGLEEERIPFLNHTGELYEEYADILRKSHGAELPTLQVHSADENKDDKVCSVCRKTIDAATIFWEDPARTIRCCYEKCYPEYHDLKTAHATTLLLRKEGLPLKRELAAALSKQLGKLEEAMKASNKRKREDPQ